MRGVADAGYYLQVVPQDPATHTVTITMGVSENGSVVEHSVDNETNFRIPIGSTGIDTSLRITLDEGTYTYIIWRFWLGFSILSGKN